MPVQFASGDGRADVPSPWLWFDPIEWALRAQPRFASQLSHRKGLWGAASRERTCRQQEGGISRLHHFGFDDDDDWKSFSLYFHLSPSLFSPCKLSKLISPSPTDTTTHFPSGKPGVKKERQRERVRESVTRARTRTSTSTRKGKQFLFSLAFSSEIKKYKK